MKSTVLKSLFSQAIGSSTPDGCILSVWKRLWHRIVQDSSYRLSTCRPQRVPSSANSASWRSSRATCTAPGAITCPRIESATRRRPQALGPILSIHFDPGPTVFASVSQSRVDRNGWRFFTGTQRSSFRGFSMIQVSFPSFAGFLSQFFIRALVL